MANGKIYIRLDVDMPEHPKIAGLSDAAFRYLVELTMYSRKYRTDGFVPEAIAGAKRSASDLLQLCENHAEKPSLLRVPGGYQIRDYAEHQDTRAMLEARRERNKIAGSAGGLARRKRTVKQVAKRDAKQDAKQDASEVLSSRAPARSPLRGSGAAPEERAAAAPNGAAPRPADPFAAEADAEGDWLAKSQAIAQCPLCGEDGYRLTTTGNPGAVCDHIDHAGQTVAGRSAASAVLAELRRKKAERNSEPRP